MCSNLSLLHTAGRVTDGGGAWLAKGDGPPPPPAPGCSRSWLSRRMMENDGHLSLGRQGRLCLAKAETQDISRNQQVPPTLPPSRSVLELGGHSGQSIPSALGTAHFLPPSALQPALWPGRQTCVDSINGPPGPPPLVGFSQWGAQQQVGEKRVRPGVH